MNDLPPDTPPAVGLRRFHKLTISAAIAFLMLLAWHYLRRNEAEGDDRALIYAAIAGTGAILLFLYLRRFSRGGGLG